MKPTMPVIVLSRELPAMFTGALAQLGEVRVLDADDLAGTLADASVYLTTGVDPVPDTLITAFPDSLKLIANIGVGTDGIDFGAAARRGIVVSNTPVVTDDTADLTMALILAATRRLSASERALRDGDWARGAGVLGTRVTGKTLGIVGFGAIGQAVARRAAGFELSIVYHGPNPKPEAAQAIGARFSPSLEALLAEADIVSLNCPLTPSTRHLMNAASLASMKPGAHLINTGRGPLVDEAALVDALRSGHLGGAGLDVFEFEPQVTAALLDFDNVSLTPHIGSATQECRTDMAMRAYANVQQFLAEGTVLDPVGG
ncbi:MAG: D-glycerate dehydrogenase [Congregibacter sp.]